MTRRIQSLYHKLSAYHKAYSNDFLWPLVLPLRQLQLKQIAKNIAQNSNSGIILDIGAGYGYLPIEIAKRCPRMQLIGIDIELELISDGIKNIQEKQLTDKVTFLMAKAESLPFVDDGFDMVVSTMSLHLWHDWQSGICEIRRVLKPGGQAWILVDRHYLLHGLAHITDYFTKRSIARMKTLYLSAGFKDCRISELDEILKIVATK
jgi:ubiquinone/menaquinone biosynthesis C-methylase UbiE